MAMQICSTNFPSIFHPNCVKINHFHPPSTSVKYKKYSIQCSIEKEPILLRTCKLCKTQFDPSLNHPQACRFHSAHFGGETKRKFESVYTGGTMNTPESGKVFQYWHCCGSEDPFHPGCTASPHSSYDDSSHPFSVFHST